MPTSSDSPNPSATILVSPSPTATPDGSTGKKTPKPTPSKTPQPTFDEGNLDVGTLSYTADSCWRANHWSDSEGHTLSGYQVTFQLPLKNSGRVDSPWLWFYVEDATDWFELDPWLVNVGWVNDDGWHWNYSTTWLAVTAPPLSAGKHTKYEFDVLFQTPFDAHYDVYFGYRDPPAFDEVGRLASQHWSLWTSNHVCV